MTDSSDIEKLPPSSDVGQLSCIQGWYDSRLGKSFEAKSKYTLVDRLLLWLGYDKSAKSRKLEHKRKENSWRLVKSMPQTKSYNLVGEGLFNMGKQYGRRSENGVMELWENELGIQKAYFITATETELISPSFARNQMGL